MYHIYWIKYGKLWRMQLPKQFGGLWDLFQYIISFSFIIFQLYYYGFLYFYLHLIGMNIGYFIGSSPDHDMYPTHLQIEEDNDNDNDNIKDWGEIQVRHSGNFMNNYPLFTRFYGGINYQIEHHLFPSVSHCHYPAISKIVKETCQEFDIEYTHHDSIITALKDVFDSFYILNIKTREKKEFKKNH